MEEKKELSVQISGVPGFADPTPVLTLVFATLCFCFWANTMGFFTEGAVLAIGILQLGVFVTYTVGGLILLHRGNGFGGNTFMIFATVFGGVGGATHLTMTIAGEAAVPFCYQICGVAFISAGVFLLAMLPGLRYGNKCDFICFLTGGLGVLGYGLTGANICPPEVNYPAAWFLLIDGLVGMYTVFAAMLGLCGIHLPLGKPFFRPKPELSHSK